MPAILTSATAILGAFIFVLHLLLVSTDSTVQFADRGPSQLQRLTERDTPNVPDRWAYLYNMSLPPACLGILSSNGFDYVDLRTAPNCSDGVGREIVPGYHPLFAKISPPG